MSIYIGIVHSKEVLLVANMMKKLNVSYLMDAVPRNNAITY